MWWVKLLRFSLFNQGCGSQSTKDPFLTNFVSTPKGRKLRKCILHWVGLRKFQNLKEEGIHMGRKEQIFVSFCQPGQILHSLSCRSNKTGLLYFCAFPKFCVPGRSRNRTITNLVLAFWYSSFYEIISCVVDLRLLDISDKKWIKSICILIWVGIWSLVFSMLLIPITISTHDLWCGAFLPTQPGVPIRLGAVEAQDKMRCLHFTLYTVYISKFFLCKEINNKITPG